MSALQMGVVAVGGGRCPARVSGSCPSCRARRGRVAPQCPDSACKQDLLAYLQRIALYCHQLNICSKVKAEVQNLGGELVVSGVPVSGLRKEVGSRDRIGPELLPES
ncbi:hypothetical protein DV515_00013891 [Chloebia gouldiae]|uniref:Uncharacterized protein n=1 Tax=Chloebia gouldiae TaxID=44316 RepID=A0A3L8RZJ2_CHLGU|nr:hypothetical protein DV515_00013891 [Chloebia gouldiae]